MRQHNWYSTVGGDTTMRGRQQLEALKGSDNGKTGGPKEAREETKTLGTQQVSDPEKAGEHCEGR